MDLACLASGFSACCDSDSLFTIITPNSWLLEFVPLTLMVVELDLGASPFHYCPLPQPQPPLGCCLQEPGQPHLSYEV